MEGMTREALRLECLKQATLIEARAGVDNVLICAEKMVAWVLQAQEAAPQPVAKAKGK